GGPVRKAACAAASWEGLGPAWEGRRQPKREAKRSQAVRGLQRVALCEQAPAEAKTNWTAGSGHSGRWSVREHRRCELPEHARTQIAPARRAERLLVRASFS